MAAELTGNLPGRFKMWVLSPCVSDPWPWVDGAPSSSENLLPGPAPLQQLTSAGPDLSEDLRELGVGGGTEKKKKKKEKVCDFFFVYQVLWFYLRDSNLKNNMPPTFQEDFYCAM